LTILKNRRIRGDLIQLFRYYKRFDNIFYSKAPALCNSSTRGHRFKFIKEPSHHYARKNNLFNKIASIWNRLPDHIINIDSVNEFKINLDTFDFSNM